MKQPTKANLMKQIGILDELCTLCKQQTLLAQSENRSLRHDIEQAERERDALRKVPDAEKERAYDATHYHYARGFNACRNLWLAAIAQEK